jgi:hypothetical protein
LIYLANNTRPDIDFSVNVLARYSSDPTRRYWNGIKDVLRYLCGTRDMGLFYRKNTKSKLVGYADAGVRPFFARSVPPLGDEMRKKDTEIPPKRASV